MAVDKYRTRTLDTEFRSLDPETPGDGRTLSGYAAVFGSPTYIGASEGRFREVLQRGAFKRTLTERAGKIAMQWQHGKDPAVGQVPIGAYTTLREDEHGLFVEGRLFDTPAAESVRAAIAGGAVFGMSFSFQILDEVWRDKDGNRLVDNAIWRELSRGREPLRTITGVKLLEAGPVLNPAYEATSVGVRGKTINTISREAALAKLRLLDSL